MKSSGRAARPTHAPRHRPSLELSGGSVYLLIGSIASFLPQRYRSAISVSVPAAAISGAAQLLLSLGALMYRYFTFPHQRLVPDSNVMLKPVARHGEARVIGPWRLTPLES